MNRTSRWFSHLFLRYAALIAIVVGSILVLTAAVVVWEAWRENESRAGLLLAERARSTATRIQEHLAGIEAQVSSVANLPWVAAKLGRDDRVFEYQRLQRVIPSLAELVAVDGVGKELVRVSRTGATVIASGRDVSNELSISSAEAMSIDETMPPRYGSAIFRDGIDPYAWVVVREKPVGYTAALVNMKFISDFVAEMKFGESGRAFVVDGSGHVIAHPDIRLLLRKLNVAQFPDVARAVSTTADSAVSVGRSFDGGLAVFVSSKIGKTGWHAVVEQSREEMLAPVLAAAYRAVLFALIGLVCALALALFLARHLTRPILQLRAAVAQIGAGNFETRANVNTGDELQGLAEEFNRMAEQLKTSYAELEARVKERTQELSTASDRISAQSQQVELLNATLTENLKELGLKKEQADNANAAKTRFLASASHDLRQPMHAISLLVGILHDRIQYPEVRLLVDKVQMSVRAMENLFDSLLDISKLDAGIVKPNFDKIEIGGQLRLIDLNYTPLAMQKGVELRIVHSRAIVNTDAVLIERIISNLVSNAIRYTARGRILVGCRRHGPSLQLLVFDTGIGIAPEYLDNIFEEFFQVANPESDRSKGLGLGLSIVKRSADLMGHRLIVKSQPGRGSTFGIELPFVGMASGEPPLPLPESIASNRLRSAFLVVIDDDKENLFAIEALCTQWGCRVVSACSAAQAIEKLTDHLRQPDLIISDFRLRDRLTGAAAVEQIRTYADALIPAIIVTGDLAGGDASRISLELVTVLGKPVNPNTLRTTADALLAMAEVRNTAL